MLARRCRSGARSIDLNFGCPAKLVNRHDGGASLLRQPERVYQAVKAVACALDGEIPVTAKIRLGFSNRRLAVACAQATEAGRRGSPGGPRPHPRRRLSPTRPLGVDRQDSPPRVAAGGRQRRYLDAGGTTGRRAHCRAVVTSCWAAAPWPILGWRPEYDTGRVPANAWPTPPGQCAPAFSSNTRTASANSFPPGGGLAGQAVACADAPGGGGGGNAEADRHFQRVKRITDLDTLLESLVVPARTAETA